MIQNAFELDASILTLSYSGDFDCCSLLCESFDRFRADRDLAPPVHANP